MDCKKQKSIGEINERVELLAKSIKVDTQNDYMLTLLDGESPQYYKRFAAWSRRTLEDKHFDNMIEALLSKYALDILLGSGEFTNDFVRGQASSLLFLKEELQRLSNATAFNKE